jgi:spore coat polysaccharide biosynthesis protein SpsF (cytidylyltransferase family)
MPPVAVIQARLGSSRLPGKVLKEVAGRPMLWHIVDRVRHAPGIDRVLVATSLATGDEPLRAFCAEQGIDCFAGDEHDVLDRFYRAAKKFDADPILRITADCPFVDPELVGRVLADYQLGGADHVSSATGATAFKQGGFKFPDGLDVECFGFAALAKAWGAATAKSDREHVTPYLYRVEGRFRVRKVFADEDRGALRWTVDHAADLEVVRRVYHDLYRPDRPFGLRDILAYFEAHPELQQINQAFIGHEGYDKVWNPDA